MLRSILQAMVESRETTLAFDEQLLHRLNAQRHSPDEKVCVGEAENAQSVEYDSQAYWKLVNCLNYRMTRKLLVDSVIDKVDDLITFVKCSADSAGSAVFSSALLVDQLEIQRSESYKTKLKQYIATINDEKLWILH